MPEQKVTIVLSRNQAEIVRNACEEYLRLRMGQFWGFADDIAEMAYPEAYKDKSQFDKMLALRDDYRDALTRLYPAECRTKPIPEDALIAETVWLGIRSALAWHDNPKGDPMSVVYDPPRSRCNEKIPTVVISDEAENRHPKMCSNCIHERACQMWCNSVRGYGKLCPVYECIHSSNAYYIGMVEAKGGGTINDE